MLTNNRDILAMLEARIEEIAQAVFDEGLSKFISQAKIPDDASAKLREQLTFIKSKEHITVREAALLMSCSESHIRKLVMLARKRKSVRPIPFLDLEGVTVFQLSNLLQWANGKPQLRVITNEAA